MTISFSDSVGCLPGQYISKIVLNPLAFPTINRGVISTMAGGAAEKFIVIKAGPSGNDTIKTHTTVVGMNIDEPSSEKAITFSHWAYAIIVGY